MTCSDGVAAIKMHSKLLGVVGGQAQDLLTYL